jgi:hypothetical protein
MKRFSREPLTEAASAEAGVRRRKPGEKIVMKKRKRVFGRNVLAAGLVACLGFPGAAQACDDWDMGDQLELIQANGFTVTLRSISRSGNEFNATAKVRGGTRGDASGRLTKSGRLKFDIDWDNGSQGSYSAHVQEDGEVVDGKTFDKQHPASWSTFTMDAIECND